MSESLVAASCPGYSSLSAEDPFAIDFASGGDGGGTVTEMSVKGASERWFTPEQGPGLEDFEAVLSASLGALRDDIERQLPLFSVAPGAPELRAQLARFFECWSHRDPSPWVRATATIDECRELFAARGLALHDWHEICARSQALLTRRSIEAYASNPARLADVLAVLQGYVFHTLAVLAGGFLQGKERELVVEQQQTQRARARFTRLAESGVLGVIVCDYQGNILEANDGFLDKFGYSREDLAAGDVRWMNMTPPEWAELDERAIEQLLAQGKTRPWEKEYYHKDGHRVPVLVGVATLNEAETIAFVLDITERKRLEEVRARSIELATENRRIQEASRLKSEFLANMSHELRTPLNSIIGFAELLHDREVPPESPQFTEFLGDILKSGRHLHQLINDVLDLAKVEAGKMELRPEHVDVEQLATEVCAVLRTVAASKQIRIETQVAPEARSATLDPGRFKQILYNYLSNALKFTLPGGKVTVGATIDPDGMLRVTVADTGIGIAREDLRRLFVEFQQLDAGVTKRHAGTGLGLALTKRLVEAQGGFVGVKSVLGQGSEFFALLPLHALPQHAVESDAGAELEVGSGAASILVVEDDARDRSLLTQVLTQAGYGVETATTGRQAIVSCKERLFDGITLDLLLPDMTGLDVLHSVRQEGKNQKTPVVVVSVVAERGIMAGFNVQDYLTKPVSAGDLLAAFQQASVPPSKSGKVLVVDDDAPSLRLMAASLEHLGYEIHCCPSGALALDFVARERPVAVVLDLLMPGIDGFEFLAAFRRDEANRSIPAIVWTMKDLTHDDRARLLALAQRVVGKNDWSAATFLTDLRALIAAGDAPLQGVVA